MIQRGAIIRALIDALEASELDAANVTNEDQLRELFTERMKRD